MRDRNEISMSWHKRQLFEINDWLKSRPEGQEYEYQMETVTGDQDLLHMRLSSSLDDFKRTLPGFLYFFHASLQP